MGCLKQTRVICFGEKYRQAVYTTFHTSYAARDENVDRTWRVGSISRAYAVRGFCNLVSLSTLYAVRYPSSMPPGVAAAEGVVECRGHGGGL